MKINFLTTKLSGLTGGVIYDEELYNRLLQRFPGQVSLIEDQNFGDEFKGITPNFRRYAQVYKKHAKELLECDYLIINSRLYTRFITFPWTINPSCKVMLIHHHFNFMTHSGILKIIHKYFEINFLIRADCLITPNPYTKDTIVKLGLKNRIALLEAYINKETHTDFKHKKDVISFIGTVEPRKGLHYGIPAFKRFVEKHPSYQFKIAGTLKANNYINKLKRIVKDLDLENNVVFLGRVNEKQKDELYKESKCFLFPSQNEGYGWVLIEAMSYGLPVIAFDNTAMPYTVNNGNGRIVKNKDIAAMGKALAEIIDSQKLYNDLANGAIATVKELPSKEQISLEYNDFFDTLSDSIK